MLLGLQIMVVFYSVNAMICAFLAMFGLFGICIPWAILGYIYAVCDV